MFNHYARVLSSIPRWSVVPVLRRQYVAEHSYYVSLYTAELLGLSIFDHWHDDRKFACLRYALIHDAEEARMSDIPGPVKRMIKDPEKLAATEAKVLSGMGYTDKYGYAWHVDEDIKRVIKAADLIDEFFYLHSEASMGSRIVSRLIDQVEYRLKTALDNLPGITESGARDLFLMVSEEAASLDAGIETLSNNADVDKARGGYVADPKDCGCKDFEYCPKCEIPF